MQPATPWIVLSVSFVMALSGALMPGPLLTYTIARTMQSRRRGYLVGAWVIAGHALLEGALVTALALGVAEFLRVPLARKVIGTVGAVFLAYMGVGLVREAVQGWRRGGPRDPAAGQETPPQAGPGSASRMHPVLAGVLVSLSNPYWWVWWVTVGSATMMRFDASLANWWVLLAFFAGHEAGDLAWYLAVSTAVHVGRRTLSGRVVAVLLGACGIFLVGFGAYLGISQYLKA